MARRRGHTRGQAVPPEDGTAETAAPTRPRRIRLSRHANDNAPPQAVRTRRVMLAASVFIALIVLALLLAL